MDVTRQLHLFGLARDRLRTAMAALLGVGLTDIDALEYLERFGPLSQRELGDRLLLTSGAVTLLVDRLERLGLVRRTAHASDRRVTVVELRPDADLPELPEMADYHADLITAAEALSPAARSEVAAFLQTLGDRADAATTAMRARTTPRARSASAGEAG
jgi:DNA-binding Lrp family transcriptional regulator